MWGVLVASGRLGRPAGPPRPLLVVSGITTRTRRGRLLRALRKAVAECIQHQLQAIRQLQLVENRGDVVPHGCFADEEPFGHLTIPQSFSDAADDLVLASGKRRDFRRFVRILRPEPNEPADDRGRVVPRQPQLARVHLAYRLEEDLGFVSLVDDAGGPSADRPGVLVPATTCSSGPACAGHSCGITGYCNPDIATRYCKERAYRVNERLSNGQRVRSVNYLGTTPSFGCVRCHSSNSFSSSGLSVG